MNRNALVDWLVNLHMENILEYPETVRDALECYFEGHSNSDLLASLKGFEFEDNEVQQLKEEGITL